jgi:type II secretory pathway component PulL
VIGFIDWTENTISLYVFKKKGGEFSLSDSLSITVEGELDESLLSRFLKPGVERFYLSIPVNLLSLREITFPFSDRDKIKETLPYELEGILLGSAGDYSIDHSVIDTSENGSRAIAACMEKSKLRDVVDRFTSAGLDPVSITCLDLRVFGNTMENLLEQTEVAKELRIEAAQEELTHPSINLRQGELAFTGDMEKSRRSLRVTGVLVLLLILVLGSYTTARYLFLKKEHSMLTDNINLLYQKTFPEDTRIIDASRQFQGKLNSLNRKKDILVGIPVLDILLNISEIKNESITLDEFRTEQATISIKGTTSEFEEVDAFRKALSLLFSDVRVTDSTSSPDKKVSFSITMKDRSL